MEIKITPLSARQAKIIEYLLSHDQASCPALTFGVSHDTGLRDVYDLIDRKMVVKKGINKGTRYFLSPGCLVTTITKVS